jgi:copper chaperone NosL
MTIVDRQHAAEIVTQKGKIFKFDAVECMVNAREEIGADNIAQYLCNTYDAPGELTDATTASFLVSKAIPSPMGANLTAFSEAEAAKRTMDEFNGSLYNWNSLLSYLKSMDFVYHK